MLELEDMQGPYARNIYKDCERLGSSTEEYKS